MPRHCGWPSPALSGGPCVRVMLPRSLKVGASKCPTNIAISPSWRSASPPGTSHRSISSIRIPARCFVGCSPRTRRPTPPVCAEACSRSPPNLSRHPRPRRRAASDRFAKELSTGRSPPDCPPPTSPRTKDPRTKDPRTKEMTREHQDARAIRPEMEPVHAQRADRGVARHPTPGIVLLACASGLPSFLYCTERVDEDRLLYQHFGEPLDEGA